MKLALSAREQQNIALFVLMGCFVAYVYFVYLVGPLVRTGGELRRHIRDSREKLKSLEGATAYEKDLRGQYEQLRDRVMSQKGMLPAEEELASVIEHLSSLANQANVKIQTIFPQRPVEEASSSDKKAGPSAGITVYRRTPIQIDALAGFHQLGTFVGLVESGGKPMQLTMLRISENRRDFKRHHVQVLLEAYFAVKEVSLVSQ